MKEKIIAMLVSGNESYIALGIKLMDGMRLGEVWDIVDRTKNFLSIDLRSAIIVSRFPVPWYVRQEPDWRHHDNLGKWAKKSPRKPQAKGERNTAECKIRTETTLRFVSPAGQRKVYETIGRIEWYERND